MRVLCVVISFLCFVTLSFAQPTCEQQILVNVRDSKGEFVPDLQPSSFRAKVAGHEVSVTLASVAARPTRLILVIDASASMTADRDTRRWMAIKSFAEQIIASAPPSIELAVVVFNTQVIRKVDFGHPRRELFAAIEQLPNAKERTLLWNSIREAIQMFGDSAPGDAVLVISDFGDNLSKAKPVEVQRAFLAKGIRLFGVGVFDQYAQSMEELNGKYDFFDAAKQTGGDVIKEIGKYRYNEAGLLKLLFDEIGRVYILNISMSAALLKPERLNLSVVETDVKKRKGIVLYYPQRLAPCVP